MATTARLPVTKEQAQDFAKAASGATGVGMAAAIWYTHPEAQPWEWIEVVGLGGGIGAAVKYVISWLDIGKEALKAKALGKIEIEEEHGQREDGERAPGQG